MRRLFEDLRRCRLCRRVAVGVFCAILAVEAVVLFVAANRYEDRLLAEVAERGRAAVHAMFATHTYAMSAPLLMATAKLLSDKELIAGGAIYGADGARIGTFGEAPLLTPGDASDNASQRSASGNRLDVFWTDDEIGSDVMMVARLDATGVSGAVTELFVWVGAIVVLVTLLAGTVTLAIVSQTVLAPLVRFRRHIQTVAQRLAEGRDSPVAESLPDRADELGDVFRAFTAMRARMAGGLAALEDRERALAEARSDFETTIAQRTTSMSEANAALLKKLADLERAGRSVKSVADLVHSGPVPVLQTDLDGVLVFANEAAQPLLAEWESAIGDPLPERWRREIERMADTGGEESPGEIDLIVGDRTFAAMPRVEAEARRVTLFAHDVTKARKALAEGLRAAVRDPLTDAASPMVLQDRLERTLADIGHRGAGALGAIHLINLDGFKALNDDLGQPGGDRVLKTVATRLAACAGPVDTVARLASDTFALIQARPGDADDIAQMAAEVLDRIAAPIKVFERVVHARASAGIAVLPADGATTETVLRHAELALSHAKGDGGGVYRFFVARMNEQVRHGRAVESAVRRGLERSEFTISYQPRRSLRTGRITAAEALLRWEHPDDGMTPAQAFLRVADRSGLIGPLGSFALTQASRLIATSAATGLANLSVSLNVSGAEVRVRDVVAEVKDAIAASGIEAQQLEIELAESFCVEDTDTAQRITKGLTDLGVGVAIDGVGAEKTGLFAIKRLRPTRLKIAAQAVRAIDAGSALGPGDGGVVARAVCRIGQAFDIAVTATGVETEAQLRFLRDIGCDEAQGHLIAHPMPGHAVQGFIESQAADIGLNLALFEGKRSA